MAMIFEIMNCMIVYWWTLKLLELYGHLTFFLPLLTPGLILTLQYIMYHEYLDILFLIYSHKVEKRNSKRKFLNSLYDKKVTEIIFYV